MNRLEEIKENEKHRGRVPESRADMEYLFALIGAQKECIVELLDAFDHGDAGSCDAEEGCCVCEALTKLHKVEG